MKGAALKSLQTLVGVTADGVFGPNTARAIVKHYQLTPEEGAHLLGQCHHESAGFQTSEESLNYSESGLQRVWPSRFPDLQSTDGYARNPEALANKVYADRMGNGDEASGDGWKYRGRGFIQLTGSSNYRLFSEAINRPSLTYNPDPVAGKYAFLAALWYFQHNGLLDIARGRVTDEVIRRITKRVNGGYHGLDDRMYRTKKVQGWLK